MDKLNRRSLMKWFGVGAASGASWGGKIFDLEQRVKQLESTDRARGLGGAIRIGG